MLYQLSYWPNHLAIGYWLSAIEILLSGYRFGYRAIDLAIGLLIRLSGY